MLGPGLVDSHIPWAGPGTQSVLSQCLLNGGVNDNE